MFPQQLHPPRPAAGNDPSPTALKQRIKFQARRSRPQDTDPSGGGSHVRRPAPYLNSLDGNIAHGTLKRRRADKESPQKTKKNKQKTGIYSKENKKNKTKKLTKNRDLLQSEEKSSKHQPADSFAPLPKPSVFFRFGSWSADASSIQLDKYSYVSILFLSPQPPPFSSYGAPTAARLPPSLYNRKPAFLSLV